MLKLWLRELAEPLIPTNLYEECLRIGKDDSLSKEEILGKAVNLIEGLPGIFKYFKVRNQSKRNILRYKFPKGNFKSKSIGSC